MQIIRLFAILFSLVLLTACGNKGPVRPLEIAAPGTIKAPELRQQGDALVLGWQLPVNNRDGSLIKQAPVVDIYRMTYDPNDDCPECFDRSTLLASINPQLPEPAQKIGKRYRLHDHSLQAGTGYQYKLIVRNVANEQSSPIILRQAYSEPVAAPQQANATAQNRSVLLQWQAPQLEADDDLSGYLVYRRNGTNDSMQLLTPQPQQETKFEDFSLDNGTAYHYWVRVLVKRGPQHIEGLASDEVSATPQEGI